MSFGYSVGDVIGGANLAYKLLTIMADSQGASTEYQEAMAELSAMQQAFIQVGQIKSHNMLPKSTINAASLIVMESMDIIASFLERTKAYQRRLSNPGSNHVQNSWYRMGWSLYKSHELRSLRDGLHCRLSSINTLLSAASFSHNTVTGVIPCEVEDSSQNTQTPSDLTDEEEEFWGGKSKGSRDGVFAPQNSNPSPRKSQSAVAKSMGSDTTKNIGEVRQSVGSNSNSSNQDLQRILQEIRNLNNSKEKNRDSDFILFKDATGRQFNYPFDMCKKWVNMEDLIKQAFLHEPTHGHRVQTGQYDLVGPGGEILLPSLWERVVQPGWTVTMQMQPLRPMYGPPGMGLGRPGGPPGGPPALRGFRKSPVFASPRPAGTKSNETKRKKGSFRPADITRKILRPFKLGSGNDSEEDSDTDYTDSDSSETSGDTMASRHQARGKVRY